MELTFTLYIEKAEGGTFVFDGYFCLEQKKKKTKQLKYLSDYEEAVGSEAPQSGQNQRHKSARHQHPGGI